MSSLCKLRRKFLSVAVNRFGFKSLSSVKQVKSFTEIPKAGLRDIWDIISSSRQKELHLSFERMQQKHGPLVRFRMGTEKSLLCSSRSAVETMFREDEHHPLRIKLPLADLLAEELRGPQGQPIKLGIFSAEGESWQRQRSAVQKAFMRPRQLATYSQHLEEIAKRAVDRLGQLRRDDGTFVDFELGAALSKWSFTGAFCILSSKSIDRLEQQSVDFYEEARHLLDRNFYLTEQLLFIPPRLAAALNLPIWREVVSNAKKFMSLFRDLLNILSPSDEAMTEHEDFYRQLQAEGMDQAELLAVCTDILNAALDTTANAAGFALYCLAKYPDIQESLRTEVLEGDGGARFIQAFLKETLRLYPVASIYSRRFAKDVVLDGYTLPKDVTVILDVWSMNRNPQHFDNPLTFDTTRWIKDRSDKNKQIDPFSYVPFGFGKRMCVGKRLAEMELQFLLQHILRRYRVVLTSKEPVVPKLRFLVTVDKPLPVALQDLDTSPSNA